MEIGIAADHGAFYLKEAVVKALEEKKYIIRDFGAHGYDPSDDYPDFVIPMAKAVSEGKIAKGIALCGSGVGACFTANKVKGVRAALITETYSAHQGVEHDDMNVICIGGRVIGEMLVMELIHAFLEAEYSGEERHERRLNKVKKLESEMGK
jgi:RpiB/LacA/LacB family sugar-phosphate isomerase